MELLDKKSIYKINKDAFGRVRIWDYNPLEGIGKLIIDKPNLITTQGADIVAKALGGVNTPDSQAITSGAVTSVLITNPGSGYSGAPTITFSAPISGTTATATASLTGSIVSGITITNAGVGYFNQAPAVTFSDPPSGSGHVTATGIAAITNSFVAGNKGTGITHMYIGYVTDSSSPPTVTVNDTVSSFADYSRIPLAFSPSYSNESGYSSNLAYFTTYITGSAVPNAAKINSLGLISSTTADSSGDLLFSKISFPNIVYSSTNGLAITWGLCFRALSS